MANITECDGCGTRIGFGPGERPPCISGQTEGTYGLAPGPFHWCIGCGGIAAKAVYEARPEDSQSETDKIAGMMAEAQEHPGRVIRR
jgi:hypothetical protein